MKKFNLSTIQIGDIILTTTTELLSKGIRKVTKGDISHALIYVGAGSVIDSTNEGVRSRSLQRLFLEDGSAVHVLRLADELSKTKARQIVDFARQRIGTQYSIIEAVRTVVGGAREPSRRQFCSRLAAQAYASAGLHIAADPNYCTPEDLKSSALLIVVPDVVVDVDKEEVEALQRIPDATQWMADVTRALLSGSRERNSAIEAVDDIDKHLQQTPEDDAYFVELFEKSGYLTVWKNEAEKNPWMYDPQLMRSSPLSDAQKQEYCNIVLNDHGEGMHRYEHNLKHYASLVQVYPLNTFRRLLVLYEKLVELQRLRRQTAEQWVRRGD